MKTHMLTDSCGETIPNLTTSHLITIIYLYTFLGGRILHVLGLQHATKDEANEFPSEVIEAILRSFYVDDWLNSYRYTTSAKETYKSVIASI